jgi:hypothetical protein
MLNTLKTLPQTVINNPVAVAVQEAALNVFSANLNVLHVTRDEGRKVFCAVKDKAGELAAGNVRQLKAAAGAANDRVNGAWGSVEALLEARVLPVLDKVGLAAPAQYGVDLVGKGLTTLTAQVVELTRERKLTKPAAKTSAVRKVAARKPAARRTKLAA